MYFDHLEHDIPLAVHCNSAINHDDVLSCKALERNARGMRLDEAGRSVDRVETLDMG